MQLGGLHHLTAITGDAAANLSFYTGVLGLRLVKKTVNQDDVSAYHLFYGDEIGNPGTEVTFFDWPWASPARPGAGTIAEMALRVPDRAALEWWVAQFDRLGVRHGAIASLTGRDSLPFADPEGQPLRLVADGSSPDTVPWSGSPVVPAAQIRGLHAVTVTVPDLSASARLLTDLLGFRLVADPASTGDGGRRTIFAVGPGGPGAELHVVESATAGRMGSGGVHHLALRTPNDEEHRAWQKRIAAADVNVTPVIDRYYFRSIYFREPGGVIVEIATDGPGFATDEDVATLGEHLALPPFLEPRRAEIEARLRPLPPVGVSVGAD